MRGSSSVTSQQHSVGMDLSDGLPADYATMKEMLLQQRPDRPSSKKRSKQMNSGVMGSDGAPDRTAHKPDTTAITSNKHMTATGGFAATTVTTGRPMTAPDQHCWPQSTNRSVLQSSNGRLESRGTVSFDVWGESRPQSAPILGASNSTRPKGASSGTGRTIFQDASTLDDVLGKLTLAQRSTRVRFKDDHVRKPETQQQKERLAVIEGWKVPGMREALKPPPKSVITIHEARRHFRKAIQSAEGNFMSLDGGGGAEHTRLGY